MTYPEVIQYLESFVDYEKIPHWSYNKSLNLERIKDFLATIDNPQDTLKCIHIAGTKGKGSTCAFISYILRQAGYKVGLYTSPHLSDFRERIRILETTDKRPQTIDRDFEGMISEDGLTKLVTRLRPNIEKYNKNSKYGLLSFFEVYTSLAFIYFKEKEVDFVVLETGLGGRLDATNAVSPLLCAITSISYEHTQKLGRTIREIATEKAGIIKPGSQLPLAVVTAPQEGEAIKVIRGRCKEFGVKLYEINKDIFYEETDEGFNVMGLFGEFPCLKTGLLGRHQLINASVAVGVIDALKFYNINVDIDSIRSGLYNTIWPGRCEAISKNPLVVLDGAQNSASSKVLKETIKENFSAEGARLPDGQGSANGGKYKKLILVLGISKDKDIKGICRELSGLADEIIVTQANTPRACNGDFIEQIIRNQRPGYKIPITKTKNVKEAKALAYTMAKKEDLILVSGSLFVVGEFRNQMKPRLTERKRS